MGIRIGGTNFMARVDGFNEPYADELETIRVRLSSIDTIVGFNLKFDLAWLARYGIDLSDKQIWDTQLAEFLFRNQGRSYPSLGDSCARFGIVAKTHPIDEFYWKRGIDTPAIPRQEIEEYLAEDLYATDELYKHQVQYLPPSKRALFQVQCEDLLCLLEMERNGLRMDEVGLQRQSNSLGTEMEGIRSKMQKYIHNWPHFNISSPEHVSALLFGGTLKVDVGTPYEHTFKGGAKAGQVAIRHRWETVTKTYEPLFKPKSEWKTTKEGVYSTDSNTVLRQLGKHELITWLLHYSELETLKSVFVDKLAVIRDKYDWQDGNIHGTFNQCVVITGRLSSEKPNLQTNPEEINEFIITRFAT